MNLCSTNRVDQPEQSLLTYSPIFDNVAFSLWKMNTHCGCNKVGLHKSQFMLFFILY